MSVREFGKKRTSNIPGTTLQSSFKELGLYNTMSNREFHRLADYIAEGETASLPAACMALPVRGVYNPVMGSRARSL